MLDLKIQQRLRKLIDEATVKNCPAVDLSLAKEIKQIVKASPELVSSAYQVLISRLGTKHCQTRILALELCNQLFTRSRDFRQNVSRDFDKFLELCTGFRPESPLPPPRDVADRLRRRSAELFQQWSEDFGAHYPQLFVRCDMAVDIFGIR
uniref:Uv-stimulated scaffold protein a n=1 Tax=Tetraselmis sp. GSL018 TaxID=582737 RepID=A0A061RX05_9CHLO|mmetsp:Transcript_3274/g.7707  ORF Transcript_3274/g.7707 Transcript_3274/m.7707 type:complete len:151 (+) Transcript_3274:186-638(+)